MQRVAQVLKEQPVFQRRKFFQGRVIRGGDLKDLSWFGPDGEEISDQTWEAGYIKCIGIRLAGDVMTDDDEHGERLVGDTLLLLFNAHHEGTPFTLPAARPNHRWLRLLDTADKTTESQHCPPGSQHQMQGRSMIIYRTESTTESLPAISSSQAENLRKDALPVTQPNPKPSIT